MRAITFQAKITLTASRRGDLQIHLTSPGGTRSTLLDRRRLDVSRAGFNRWPFMTVHSWGETPVGIWQLEIHNEGRYLGKWLVIVIGYLCAADSLSLLPNTGALWASNSTLKAPRLIGLTPIPRHYLFLVKGHVVELSGQWKLVGKRHNKIIS